MAYWRLARVMPFLLVAPALLTTAGFLGQEHLRSSLQPASRARDADDGMPPAAWRAFEALAEEKHYKLQVGSSDAATPTHPEALGSVFEAVQVSLPLHLPTIKHNPASGSGRGDDNIVGMNQMTRGGHRCIVYGMGIGHDPDFVLQMQRAGCEIHTFDCGIDPKDAVVAGRLFKFHHWCVGRRTDTTFFNQISLNNKTGMQHFQFKSLADTMTALGHKHVDVLKFDVKGFEWQLFVNEILPIKNPPEQLAFELHTEKANPAWVAPSLVRDKGYVEVNRLFKSLYDKGYRVVSKELKSGDPASADFVVLDVKKGTT